MPELFAIFLLAIAAATPASAADKPAKIGFLSWFPPAMKAQLDHFREGMQRLGYVEGNSYEIEAHFTDKRTASSSEGYRARLIEAGG